MSTLFKLINNFRLYDSVCIVSALIKLALTCMIKWWNPN